MKEVIFCVVLILILRNRKNITECSMELIKGIAFFCLRRDSYGNRIVVYF